MQEYELLLDYEDWAVYYDTPTNTFIYLDKETKDWKYVELIATLIYTLDNQPKCEDTQLFTMFDHFCCGERVDENYIYYQWFKEID
jgi:hypothetical protein